MARISEDARFWSKVDRSGECWVWLATRDRRNYGKFSVHHQPQAAHRVAWRLVNGPIPVGLCVLHHCDNPPCVRPEHLFLGTIADNNADKVRKGRARGGPGKSGSLRNQNGERNVRAKLTEADVKEMRRRSALGETPSSIAADFPVTRGTVSGITTGARWRHVV